MQALFRTLGYAHNLWPYYLGIAAFSILMAATQLAVPFIIKEAVDVMVAVVRGGAPDYTYVILLAVALLAVDAGNTLFTNFGGYLGDVMTAKLRKQLSERYYQHLLSLPQGYFDRELTGTIINRLNRTITEVTQFLNMFANNFLTMILTIVAVLGILLFYSWEIALLVFVVYPIFLWLTALTSKKWQVYENQKNRETDIASGRFAEAVGQIKVVKSFIKEKLELATFQKHFGNTVNITYKQSKLWHNNDIWRRLVLNTIFFGVYLFIFLGTLDQRFSIGEMFLLIQLVTMVRVPIFSMSFIVDNTQRAITGCKDYAGVMAIRPAIVDKEGATPLNVTNGEITFNQVDFGYSRKKTVLKNISFNVAAGSKVALVGESGEGKTTITNLLLRLYEPDRGSIMIDGADVAAVQQASLREHIAVVFQDPALFSGTIRENIAYANPGISQKDIEAAARAANAHEFISKLEDGYDSQIGERGLKLSGGQKQRIAIARAILKDAPILILDEATSSLDSRAEAQVQEALERLMQGRTTLIIAHRLSTIAHVDTIVTIKGGTVGEVGPPHELAVTGGIYAQLLELQMGTTEQAKKKLKQYDIAAA